MTNLRVEDLALKIQEMLGENYRVNVNCDINPSSNKIQAVLYPTRKPYKIEGINSEVIEIYIELYMPVLIQEKKEQILAHVNRALNGYRKGIMTSNGEEFSFFSFLDFIRPLQAPVVDTGTMMQLIALTGSVLITGNDGAVASNEIKTSITLFPDNSERSITQEIEVLSATPENTVEPESPLMSREKKAKSFSKTQSNHYTYVFLLMKDKFCKAIVEGLYGEDCFELNQPFQITEVYPFWNDLTIVKDCVLVSGSISRNAGAFATVTMTFHDRLEVSDE